jgi:hypothetical protein
MRISHSSLSMLKVLTDERLVATMPRLSAWNVGPTIGLQVQGSNTFRRELHPGTDVARSISYFGSADE